MVDPETLEGLEVLTDSVQIQVEPAVEPSDPGRVVDTETGTTGVRHVRR
jgi:hypothetical protein